MQPVRRAGDGDRGGVGSSDRLDDEAAAGTFAEAAPAGSGLRFVFYGRVSTEDFQHPATSRSWKLTVGTDLV